MRNPLLAEASSRFRRLGGGFGSTETHWLLRVAALVTITVLVPVLLWRGGKTDDTVVRIAFVGNSFQFVNDFPRMFPRIASKTIQQDSCLHGSLSLVTLLKKGNGMRNRWKTELAWNETLQLYDYGSCTVPQLLMGRDDYLQNGNYANFYTNDGKNPCFPKHGWNSQYDDDLYMNDDDDNHGARDDDDDDYYADSSSDAYLEYTLETKMAAYDKKSWDYVIFNDQSMRPAIPSKRNKSMHTLNFTYAYLLERAGATPVFISTWGYWRKDINVTALYGIRDVPHFTAKLHRGYELYAETLRETSKGRIQPLVAPVGIAFLTIWEEYPNLWNEFFGPDLYHPSPHGTYLMACVVHATIFGRLPDPPKDLNQIASYFSRARSMHLTGYDQPFPTKEEAVYMRWIARRVVLHNHRPRSFQQAWADVIEEEATYGYSDDDFSNNWR